MTATKLLCERSPELYSRLMLKHTDWQTIACTVLAAGLAISLMLWDVPSGVIISVVGMIMALSLWGCFEAARRD